MLQFFAANSAVAGDPKVEVLLSLRRGLTLDVERAAFRV
jgi:hypothetical protein